MKLRKLAVALAATVTIGSAQASLFDRGGGMIYDDMLDITWLQDANYARTSGYKTDNNGKMTWNAANAWANQLVYSGYSDWRLPTLSPINGTAFNYNNGFYVYDGSVDIGYNISAKGSVYVGSTANELAYMNFINLGNIAGYDINGIHYPAGWGLNNSSFVDGSNGNTVGFLSVYPGSYWQNAEYDGARGMFFDVGQGAEGVEPKRMEFYAWAVRDGDIAVSSVPAPSAFILMLTGLGVLGLIKRFRTTDKEA